MAAFLIKDLWKIMPIVCRVAEKYFIDHLTLDRRRKTKAEICQECGSGINNPDFLQQSAGLDAWRRLNPHPIETVQASLVARSTALH